MGRKATIFHGTGARPEWIWYPWLADRLKKPRVRDVDRQERRPLRLRYASILDQLIA